jgi:hypothetical protein
MFKQKPDPCDELLQQWQMRRELANYYMTALLRLSPDAPDALHRRQELSKKIFVAQLCLKQIDDQLQCCYEEHDRAPAKRL